MTRLPQSPPLLTLLILLTIPSLTLAQCNTDQNPYCRGNRQFEAICCPYPNVCYWADRQGTPACCSAGQVCLDGAGGGLITPQPQNQVPTTTYTSQQQQQTTQPLSTITSYVSRPPQENTVVPGGVVVIYSEPQGPVEEATSAIGGVFSTVTSEVVGAFSTVTSNVAGAFSTVTSEVVGAFETVTSTVGAVATAAATDLVQNINGVDGRLRVEGLAVLFSILGAMVVSVMI